MSNRIPEDPKTKDRRAEQRAKLTAHRSLATWGDRLVPLSDFRNAVRKAGQDLSPEERQKAVESFLAPSDDRTPTEGPYSKIAVFGGVYNNHYALTSLLEDAATRGAEALYCLGDLGGFGPSPERVWPLLREGNVLVSQGNYEQSLASGREDCNCGYADPRDNHFARVSYEYTADQCSLAFRDWMGKRPARRRVLVGDRELLLVHGSPRRVNEFLFESTTSEAYLETVLDQEQAMGVLCTHSGLQWHRRLPSGRDAINVGVIGRPANDGRTNVWYALLEAKPRGELQVELVPLVYDFPALALEMKSEGLPSEFIATIETGWWTTCLEILPTKERSRGRY